MRKFFWIYGVAVLSFLAVAEIRGWSLTSYDEVKGVPKSLRDNPGSYRSTYSRFFHK